MKLGMWVVMGTSTTHMVYHHRMHIFNTSFAYCSDWLITKKSNIQTSVWATLMKLGMKIVMGTSTTHVVCHHKICIFNTSFAYLFSLANNKKGKYPEFLWATLMKLGMWVVVGTVLPTRSVVTECAYLIPPLHICSDWPIKKGNYLEFCLSYTDEIWYIDSQWVVVGTGITQVPVITE